MPSLFSKPFRWRTQPPPTTRERSPPPLAPPTWCRPRPGCARLLRAFPATRKVLGLAARFEQARGNNERAADYWRAALATMPPDSAVKSLDSGLGYPAGSIAPPAPGDTKRLLDPRHEPMANSLPPLPAYPTSAPNHAPVSLTGPPAESAPQHQWLNTPSNDPLPMPGGPGVSIVPLPNSQGAAPGNAPVYASAKCARGNFHRAARVDSAKLDAPSCDVAHRQLNSQAEEGSSASCGLWRSAGAIHGQSPDISEVPVCIENPNRGKCNRTRSQARVSIHASTSPHRNAGTVHLPPSEQTIASTEPVAPAAPASGLRIASVPMGPLAAQVHARFAEETDSQLTQGSASAIHTLANAPATAPIQLGAAPTPQAPAQPARANTRRRNTRLPHRKQPPARIRFRESRLKLRPRSPPRRRRRHTRTQRRTRRAGEQPRRHGSKHSDGPASQLLRPWATLPH